MEFYFKINWESLNIVYSYPPGFHITDLHVKASENPYSKETLLNVGNSLFPELIWSQTFFFLSNTILGMLVKWKNNKKEDQER